MERLGEELRSSETATQTKGRAGDPRCTKSLSKAAWSGSYGASRRTPIATICSGSTLKAVKVVSVARSPWQNPYAERIIGTLRRDCLDHVVIFGARHLRRILTAYSHYYNGTRTHLSLDKDAPLGRPVQRHGAILDAVCRKLRKNMNQKITGFHKDEENHWVADLECGHAQHVRHDPPWMDRPWTQTQEGRNSRLGMELDCVRCDELGAAVAESVRALIGKTVQEAYENAGISGLCAEGRWDVTMDSLRALDLKPSIVSALRPKTS